MIDVTLIGAFAGTALYMSGNPMFCFVAGTTVLITTLGKKAMDSNMQKERKRQTWAFIVYLMILVATLVWLSCIAYAWHHETPADSDASKLSALTGLFMAIILPFYVLPETDIYISIRYFLSAREKKNIVKTVINGFCCAIATCTLIDLILYLCDKTNTGLFLFSCTALVLLRIGYVFITLFSKIKERIRKLRDKQKT